MRFEFKYLVPNDFLDSIRSDMRPFVNIDKYAYERAAHEYTVKSIYFDSPNMDCYHGKIAGIRVRKKFRIRGYNDPQKNDIIFLEIKRKYENSIAKNRAPLYYRDVVNLFDTRDIDKYILSLKNDGQEKEDASRFFYYCQRKKLNPTVITIYDREAFFGKFDPTLRITFDKYLRCAPCTFLSGFDIKSHPKPVLPTSFIFELKFYGFLPAWVTQLIDRYQMPRLALSKYTMCLDSQGSRVPFTSHITIKHCFNKMQESRIQNV
jgi:hypothetical protein